MLPTNANASCYADSMLVALRQTVPLESLMAHDAASRAMLAQLCAFYYSDTAADATKTVRNIRALLHDHDATKFPRNRAADASEVLFAIIDIFALGSHHRMSRCVSGLAADGTWNATSTLIEDCGPVLDSYAVASISESDSEYRADGNTYAKARTTVIHNLAHATWCCVVAAAGAPASEIAGMYLVATVRYSRRHYTASVLMEDGSWCRYDDRDAHLTDVDGADRASVEVACYRRLR